MSRKTITKQVETLVCEFCDEEIDIKRRDYCYHHVLAGKDGYTINHHEYGVNHILFSWLRPQRKDAPETYVCYDFHAGCFDSLMAEFLKNKNAKDIV